MHETRPALVIGYGNTLRRDDGVGPRAAAAVQAWGRPDVAALAVTQLTPELAESLAAARLAIFVDARIASEGDPSSVQVEPLVPSGGGPGAFSHSVGPRGLLSLAREVYGACPRAWLVTVPAADLGLGEDLSPLASRGLENALTRIEALVR